MSAEINFNELWNKQESTIPDIQVVYKKAADFRKKNLRKLIVANICLLLTSIFIIFIWYTCQPQLIITKVGIVLVILAMALYLLVYNRMIPLLTNISDNTSSVEYLGKLVLLRSQQRYLQHTMLNVYFILLSIGICMYMIEYTMRMQLLWAVISYVVTLTWIGFNWFFIRPKMITKQEGHINSLIQQIENIQSQLNNTNTN